MFKIYDERKYPTMVQTRSQTEARNNSSLVVETTHSSTNPNVSSIVEKIDTSIEEPYILGPDEAAIGKPTCYLAWGRFMTESEYKKSSGKTIEEVNKMMFYKKEHLLGWTKENHYMSMGGQCGQSCGCCRTEVYKSGVDPDAKFGACDICL
tara:strand:- start:60 stop:512 length:453 start_codon:yes stop_codon:yes gene_type:complete